MTFYPPNPVYLTQTNSFQNNTEYPSMVIVHSAAHNFQLNKLCYGCVFEEAESSVFKTNVDASPAVRYVKLISSMVSELVLLNVHWLDIGHTTVV